MEHEIFETLIDDAWITEPLYEVKSGKEATVYCCRAHERTGLELAAVKIFRPRNHRGFDNEAAYRDGEFVPTRRARLALQKKSKFGRQVQHGTWVSRELETMRALHRAGATIPRPVYGDSEAIVMEYLGDEEGAAPRLHQVRMNADEARGHLDALLANVRLWLRHNFVHGDLSPYNILFWKNQLVVIDFPQACDARFNSNAREFLARDVERVCAYFRPLGVEVDAAAFADCLWRDFENARL